MVPRRAHHAIMGPGAQSESQAMAFHALPGIEQLRAHDVDATATATRETGTSGTLDLITAPTDARDLFGLVEVPVAQAHAA